jgi:TetR/AcrR family fatty acid metabolism transcriptional regulator
MARRDPRVVDTKQRILDAALALFSERGYHDVSADEIAARTGVTKGALYYYFSDTADLARDLAHQLLERLETDARHALDHEQGTIVNLKRGFDAFLNRLHHLPEARFFLRDCRAIPSLNIDGDEKRAGSVTLIRSLIERGIAGGELIPVDADALAHVLIGACAEATLHVLATGRADGAVQVVHRFIDGLAAPRRGAGAGRRLGLTQAPPARAHTPLQRVKPPSRRKTGRQDR